MLKNNELVYEECSWISNIAGDEMAMKNFLMNHCMRLAIFNKFASLKLLYTAETRFASITIMLKRFKLINGGCKLWSLVTNKHAIERMTWQKQDM